MKRTHTCPKCSGRRIWVIERFRIPGETGEGQTLPLVPHLEQGGGGFLRKMNPVGHVDLYVCGGCGYSELYADDFANLRENMAAGVRLLDASAAPAGPFR